MGDTLFNVITGIFILLLMAGLVYFKGKQFKTKPFFTRKSRYIEVVDRIVLASDKHIDIIKMGNTAYVLGISSNSIDVLVELPFDSLVEIQKDSMAFNTMLDKILRKSKNIK